MIMHHVLWAGLPWWLRDKDSACNAGDTVSIHESGRFPGGGNGYPLQYSCLGNPMDREAWWGYSPWDHKRVGHYWATKQQQQQHYELDTILVTWNEAVSTADVIPAVKRLTSCGEMGFDGTNDQGCVRQWWVMCLRRGPNIVQEPGWAETWMRKESLQEQNKVEIQDCTKKASGFYSFDTGSNIGHHVIDTWEGQHGQQILAPYGSN